MTPAEIAEWARKKREEQAARLMLKDADREHEDSKDPAAHQKLLEARDALDAARRLAAISPALTKLLADVRGVLDAACPASVRFRGHPDYRSDEFHDRLALVADEAEVADLLVRLDAALRGQL